MSVAIVDYGSGNLHSAHKAFERAAREAGLNRVVKVTSDPDDVLRAEHIVLPGVGAFADCRRGLDAVPGMVEALEEAVRRRGRPFLGICVGMQLMATRGLEYEVVSGLNWIGGDVAQIPGSARPQDFPHGLEHAASSSRSPVACRNRHRRRRLARLFRPLVPALSGRSRRRRRRRRIRRPVTAMVGRENVVGTQFHPEKSQKLGLALIANFLRWRP